ncbi:MAG: ATP-grasp domain-containing protein [Candidatus Hodarchaeota archaeon]
MESKLRIAFAYNVERKRTAEDPKDLNAEFDSPRTLLGIKEALEKNGHQVICIEANENFYEKLLEIRDEIDIVFNIAEGFTGDSRESIYPVFCEDLNIPYTGSNPATLAIGLNKDAAKKIWLNKGISTPKFQIVNAIEDLDHFVLEFPVIVKPVHEGTSKGINNDSYVEDFEHLKQKVKFTLENYEQEALIEEFIDGREFTVGVLGNGPYTILDPVEIDFSYLPEGIRHFCSYEVKTDFDDPDSTICPADITEVERNELQQTALEAYKAIGCLDFGRCDLRLKEGKAYVIEINPLPGISSDPEVNHSMPKAAKYRGLSYSEFINNILENALKRYSIESS